MRLLVPGAFSGFSVTLLFYAESPATAVPARSMLCTDSRLGFVPTDGVYRQGVWAQDKDLRRFG